MPRILSPSKFYVTNSIRKKLSTNLSCIISLRSHHSSLDNAYVPHLIERDCHNDNYFHSKRNSKEKFTLLLPPPNITGTLHLGHALAVTIQDVLVRYNNMRGIETRWLPGFDHAGIATQVIVEKKLWKERTQTKQDLGRVQFENEILNWKNEKINVISRQLKQMGASLDWSGEFFTMDSIRSVAVTEAFIKLYQAGLIYRSDYLVNWSCSLKSAISDIEVDHIEIPGPTLFNVPGYDQPIQFGILTKFAYKLCDSEDKEIIVATTRPETILGDVAIAVHPNDERYSSFIGRMCWHPFRNEKIPIISDKMVDKDFGTGAVKVTPGHDHMDFEIGKRHDLTPVQIIDEDGRITSWKLKEVQRFKAREIVIDELHRLNLIRSREDHKMIVPICSRSKDVVEYLLKPQWFLKCKDMALRALSDVNQGKLDIQPKHFVKDWSNWLENIRDWCISRQLWWGHRIPVYFCRINEDGPTYCVAARDIESAKLKAASDLNCTKEDIIAVQDEDVLDTWFSSALLPVSSCAWPNSKNLNQYYPLSLMETGHDILFFWVARMVMLGTYFTGQLPFSKVLLHGIVCDTHGRKMSKSLGNVIAPEDVILGSSLQELGNKSKHSYLTGVLTEDELEKALRSQKSMFPQGIPDCGSDALRFTFCTHNIKNHYIHFDVQECKINKFFGNKLWQATKFVNKWIDPISQVNVDEIKYENLETIDKWILSRVSFMVETVNGSFKNYDFHIATSALKNFLYYEFCDIYLEATKRGLRLIDSPIASNHSYTLSTCLDIGFRCLNPFMPRLAKHLHEHLLIHPKAIRNFDFPEDLSPWRNIEIEHEVDKIKEIVVSIRRLKTTFNLSGKHRPIKAFLISQSRGLIDWSQIIADLSGCDEIIVKDRIESNFLSEVVSDNVGSDLVVHLVVPADVKEIFRADLDKLERKKEKLFGELEKMKKMTSAEGYKVNVSAKTFEGNLKKITTLEEKIARIDFMQKLSESFESKL